MAEARLQSARDVAGRLREYETIYILRPDINDGDVSDVNTKVRGIIEGHGGVLLKIENWGKRRLAYTVKKQRKGTYVFWSYLAKAGLVDEVERNLRITDPVIRYYTVKIAENVDPKERGSVFSEESFSSAGVVGQEEPEHVEAAAPESSGDDDGDSAGGGDGPEGDEAKEN